MIALGSNVEPEHNIPLALVCLSDAFRLCDVSRFYQTDPVGPPGQPDFWNGAALVETELEGPRLVKALRRIEHLIGRRRTADRYAPRPIDLDVLWVQGEGAEVPPHLAASLRDLGL